MLGCKALAWVTVVVLAVGLTIGHGITTQHRDIYAAVHLPLL